MHQKMPRNAAKVANLICKSLHPSEDPVSLVTLAYIDILYLLEWDNPMSENVPVLGPKAQLVLLMRFSSVMSKLKLRYIP